MGPPHRAGLITYGVYLLHPVVCSSLGMLLRKLGIRPALYARIAFALLEEPLIRLGRRLTSAPGPAPAALVAN